MLSRFCPDLLHRLWGSYLFFAARSWLKSKLKRFGRLILLDGRGGERDNVFLLRCTKG